MPRRKIVGSRATDLPNGWRMKTTERKNGNKKDIYYFGPGKKLIRSFVDLRKHFGDTLSLDGFNFKTGRFEGGSSTHNKVSSVSSSRKPKKSASEMNTNPESMVPDTIFKDCKSEKQAVKILTSTEILMSGTSSFSSEPMEEATETSMPARSVLSVPFPIAEIIKRTKSMAAESTSTSRKPLKHTVETSMMTNESKVTGTTFKIPEPIRRLMAKSTLEREHTRQTGETSLTTEVMMTGTTSENRTPKSKKQASKMLTSTEVMMTGTTSKNRKPTKRAAEKIKTTESTVTKITSTDSKFRKRPAKMLTSTEILMAGTTSENRTPKSKKRPAKMLTSNEVMMTGTTSENRTPKSKKQASKMLTSTEILMAGTTSNNSHNYMKRTSEASTTSKGATSKKRKSILGDDAEMRVVKGTTHKGISIKFEKEVDTPEQTSADNDDNESTQSSIDDFHSQLDSRKKQTTPSQLVNTIFKSFEDNEESDHLRKRILSEKRDLLKKCTEVINERAAKKKYTKRLTKPKTAADIEKLIRQRKEICEKMLAFLVENN